MTAVAARDRRHRHSVDRMLAVGALPVGIRDPDVRGGVHGVIEERARQRVHVRRHSRRPAYILKVLLPDPELAIVVVKAERAHGGERRRLPPPTRLLFVVLLVSLNVLVARARESRELKVRFEAGFVREAQLWEAGGRNPSADGSGWEVGCRAVGRKAGGSRPRM